MIEFRLRDKHRLPGAINIRSATPPHFLRWWRYVILIHEEWEMEHAGRRFKERDETILCIEHFVQRQMDQSEQIVELVGHVDGMDNFKRYLALEFGALVIADVFHRSFIAHNPAGRVAHCPR